MDKIITGYGIELRKLTENSLEKVRNWRNHPEVSRFMVNQESISKEQQQAWFHQVSHSPACAHYLICYRDQEIGLIYLHSADGLPLRQAATIEPGMYLAYDSPYRGTILAFCPALAMNDYCFEKLPCKMLIAKVKHDNRAALRFNEQLGYKKVSADDHYIQLELWQSNYLTARETLSRFIRF